MVGSLLICFVLALAITDSQHVSAADTVRHDDDMLENLKAGEHAWKHLKAKPRRNRAVILKGSSSFHLPIRIAKETFLRSSQADQHRSQLGKQVDHPDQQRRERRSVQTQSCAPTCPPSRGGRMKPQMLKR